MTNNKNDNEQEGGGVRRWLGEGGGVHDDALNHTVSMYRDLICAELTASRYVYRGGCRWDGIDARDTQAVQTERQRARVLRECRVNYRTADRSITRQNQRCRTWNAHTLEIGAYRPV